MAAVAATGLRAATPEPKTVSVISNPDWQTKPTTEQMERYYPQAARLAGVDGRATIECTVDKNGFVKDCKVVSETPPGMGFGEATIKASVNFRMRPKTVDGRPVDGAQVTVTLRWVMADGMQAGDGARIVTPAEWASRPTAEQVEAARPNVKTAAIAALSCKIIRSGREVGVLSECKVLGERPNGIGVGAAALGLTRYFRVAPDKAASAPPEAVVEIPFGWAAPSPAQPPLSGSAPAVAAPQQK